MEIAGRIYNEWGTVIGSGLSLDENGVITAIAEPVADDAQASGECPASGARGRVTVLPGLVDIHCHGGGGFSFPDDIDDEAIETAARTHLLDGTTHLIASLVSMVDPLPAIHALVRACERGTLVGIHMEGPYISPCKAGAQNPAAIRPADVEELRTWLEAGKGWIKSMTIAPETENAAEAARLLIDYGAWPSWGHTSTDSATTAALIEATTAYGDTKGVRPAQTATHTFNAMPSLHHREPGPVRELIAAAKRGEAVCELIGDGAHLAPALVVDVLSILDDPEQPGACLVTDAMAGAGMADGQYSLGGLDVTITDGVARLSEAGNIAGGTARLATEIPVLMKAGATLPMLVRAVCASPNRALGLGIDFKMRVGEAFTGVLLDEGYQVIHVFKDGRLIR